MGKAIELFLKALGKILTKRHRVKPPKKPKRRPANKLPSCKIDCSKAAKNPYKNRSRSQNKKAAKSEEKLIREHEKKLDDYRRSPEKHDNRGTYRNAPNEEIRKKVYEGRIRELEKQINRHKKELKKLEEAMKDD
ncbi:hypothetical protein [Candidatus Thiosymbion oneisti]|uniref:hypothetical protein n=1 Tax=Candidatus Thiosymbion oneisti TaxID=589554 RepID=UPI00114CF67A|nr:hypothetical protein [Candidatus Thiosymbion oneisti]